jgi:ATP-dependent helicase Lhr and Lhr-like helicase
MAGRSGRIGARRRGYGRPVVPTRTGPPTVTGRWSLLPDRDPDPTRRSHAIAQALLDRHGIVTRGSVVAERVPGGFGALYPVLRAMEEAGQCRRGYFVEGLGAAQFALPGAVDRMRAVASAQEAAAGGPPSDTWHPRWPGQPPPAGPPRIGGASRPGASRPERAARPDGPAWPEGVSWPEGAVWADEDAGADDQVAGSTTAGDAAALGRGGNRPASGSATAGDPATVGRGGDGAGSGTASAGDPTARGGGGPGAAGAGLGPGFSGGATTAETGPPITVLAAADPANAFGAALPWPPRPGEVPGAHRPGRKAGALVVLSDGKLVLYVERGGKTLLSWTSDPEVLVPAAMGLAEAVRGGALGRLTVERADGTGVYDTPLAQALADAGFRPTPRGLRLRG